MNKKRILIFGTLLILLILVFLPSIKNLFKEDVPSSPYAEFETFIPYTMGYFPENFSILSVGTDAIHQDDLDQFDEWYISETHYIKIIQSQGESIDAQKKIFVANLSRLIQGQKVELKTIDDPTHFFTDEIDLSLYNTDQIWLLTFFIDDLRIQIISNLSGSEISAVAENLVPSICLNPTKESS